MEKNNRVVIIGAGIAGAATAYFLTRLGFRNVVILESEKIAGTLSTGRNAAILRSAMPDPVLRTLGRMGADFYQHPPEGFSTVPLLHQVGLYLVSKAEHAQSLLSWAPEDGGARIVDPAQLYERVPVLAPGVALAVYDRHEGVLDVHAILQSFLRGACSSGAELRLSCEALKLGLAGSAVSGVETSEGFLDAGCVVMAGGGWASTLASRSGLPMPLVPYRRHLLVTNPLRVVDANWPVVWCQGNEFYFRPESGGLLMCACDTVPVRPEEGQATDPAQLERIALRASEWLPSLENAGVARAWAGMRIFAPDRRFVIGPDPRVTGLQWVAGLGGHGITSAPAVGRLAAEWIARGESDLPVARDLLPSRLL